MMNIPIKMILKMFSKRGFSIGTIGILAFVLFSGIISWWYGLGIVAVLIFTCLEYYMRGKDTVSHSDVFFGALLAFTGVFGLVVMIVSSVAIFLIHNFTDWQYG